MDCQRRVRYPFNKGLLWGITRTTKHLRGSQSVNSELTWEFEGENTAAAALLLIVFL